MQDYGVKVARLLLVGGGGGVKHSKSVQYILPNLLGLMLPPLCHKLLLNDLATTVEYFRQIFPVMEKLGSFKLQQSLCKKQVTFHKSGHK